MCPHLLDSNIQGHKDHLDTHFHHLDVGVNKIVYTIVLYGRYQQIGYFYSIMKDFSNILHKFIVNFFHTKTMVSYH